MDFSFNHSEVQLRSSLQGYLARHYGFTDIMACRTTCGFDARIWTGLANEIGILGLLVPGRCGGLDGSTTELLVVVEELGYALVQVPYIDAAVTAVSLLRKCTSNIDARLSAIAEGREICVTALGRDGGARPVAGHRDAAWTLSGEVHTVLNGPAASHILVAVDHDGGLGLMMLDTASLHSRMMRYPTIDGRSACNVDLEGLLVPESALVSGMVDLTAELPAVIALTRAALGAEAIGLMRRMLVNTREFCLGRRQFDQPIATFQVLQHRLVDMYLQFELATSAVYRAMVSLDGAADDRDIAVSAMAVTVTEALAFVSQNAIQLHGGMGMTDEMPISHYFRRATAIGLEMGSLEQNLSEFASLRRRTRSAGAPVQSVRGETQ